MRAGFPKYTYPQNDWGKIVLPKEEEEMAYDHSVADVIENTRYYLDNLEHIREFQVSWLYYGSRQQCQKQRRLYAVSHPKTKKASSFINKTSVNKRLL